MSIKNCSELEGFFPKISITVLVPVAVAWNVSVLKALLGPEASGVSVNAELPKLNVPVAVPWRDPTS